MWATIRAELCGGQASWTALPLGLSSRRRWTRLIIRPLYRRWIAKTACLPRNARFPRRNAFETNNFDAAEVMDVFSTASEIIIASERIQLGLLHALTSSCNCGEAGSLPLSATLKRLLTARRSHFVARKTHF
jgi:hypothetical protein